MHYVGLRNWDYSFIKYEVTMPLREIKFRIERLFYVGLLSLVINWLKIMLRK